jgi:hypothetical protein|tara:strand:+ start:1321 stop:1584 length:264 start_codon:yes stop_codon:yes gene_type:complete
LISIKNNRSTNYTHLADEWPCLGKRHSACVKFVGHFPLASRPSVHTGHRLEYRGGDSISMTEKFEYDRPGFGGYLEKNGLDKFDGES